MLRFAAAAAAVRRRWIGGLFFFSSSSTSSAAAEIPSLKPHFMAEYLVRVCGFSSDEASKASQRLSHLKSTQNPDSLLSLMRSHGFDAPLLRTLISRNPRFLCKKANKALAANFRSLRDIGFSVPDLSKVILSNPGSLSHRSLVPKIQLLRELVGSHHQFMRLLNYKLRFLGSSMEDRFTPNLSLLRGCGLPDSRIGMLVAKNPWIIAQSPERLADVVNRVERLGVPCSSNMFIWGVRVLQCVTEAKVKARMQFMGGLGWSEPEFLSAFGKLPAILAFTDDIIRRKMSFLVKEVGFEPSAVALHPSLLGYSMEKRLVPRYRVIQTLKSRGIDCGKRKLTTVLVYSDKRFIEEYVIPYEEKVLELKEIFADRGGAG